MNLMNFMLKQAFRYHPIKRPLKQLLTVNSYSYMIWDTPQPKDPKTTLHGAFESLYTILTLTSSASA